MQFGRPPALMPPPQMRVWMVSLRWPPAWQPDTLRTPPSPWYRTRHHRECMPQRHCQSVRRHRKTHDRDPRQVDWKYLSRRPGGLNKIYMIDGSTLDPHHDLVACDRRRRYILERTLPTVFTH